MQYILSIDTCSPSVNTGSFVTASHINVPDNVGVSSNDGEVEGRVALVVALLHEGGRHVEHLLQARDVLVLGAVMDAALARPVNLADTVGLPAKRKEICKY